MIAIWQGDLAAVTKLVASGVDLNVAFKYCEHEPGGALKITPLESAISQKHVDIVNFLLQHGASPNLCVQGTTPLHFAANVGDAASAVLLVRAGAEIDSRGQHNETPLLTASQHHDSLDVVKLLLQLGADVHATDKRGNNALMLAASQHNEPAVRFLFRSGLDACAKNEAGMTALDMAISNQSPDPDREAIITFLREKCSRN